MTTDDQEKVELMADELARKGPLKMHFNAGWVLQLTGLVQLALRHPHLTDTSRLGGELFLEHVRGYLYDCPHTLDTVQKGDDPDYDV